MSLGDLVSLSFRKCRQNFGLYWSALFVPALGASVGSEGAFFCFNHWVGIASKSMLAVAPFAAHMAIVLLCIIVWGVSIWELLLRASAIIRLILGLDATFAEAYKTIKMRGMATFLAYNLILLPPLALLLLWTFVAFLFVSFIPMQQPLRLIVGSVGFGLMGFGLTVSVALSSLFGALLTAIIACEGSAFSESIRRATFFFKQRMLRGGSFVCLLTLSLMVVYVACFSPIIVVDVVETYTHARLGLVSKSIGMQVLGAMLDTCFNVVSFGVAFTGYGLFYRDLCLRLEGRDILSKISKLPT
ncbi:MAG: hypothetical protein KGS72_02195 [Cyanobacteria bacterium REEB67]|nr:hypothetical protein [Cyanobacteria bacterium REEB67]